MSKIIDIELQGDCDLCNAEDLEIRIFVDKFGKGHKLCDECVATLVKWGLILRSEGAVHNA